MGVWLAWSVTLPPSHFSSLLDFQIGVSLLPLDHVHHRTPFALKLQPPPTCLFIFTLTSEREGGLGGGSKEVNWK